MMPENEDDDNFLVPIDISASVDDFPTTGEDLVEKLGPMGAAEAIVRAAEHFKKTSKAKFQDEDRPVQMTVNDWMTVRALDEVMLGEEGGEEEELEGDEEVDPDEAKPSEPPAKKAKSA